MATQSINRVVLTGNLTRDPELRATGGETSVCRLRVACNGRRRGSEGQWEDKPNYFDIVVFGAQAENVAEYLHKGRAVALDGRLDWQEWEDDEGRKRQSVKVIAQAVQFLGSPGDGRGAPDKDVAAEASGLEGAPREDRADDDIPF